MIESIPAQLALAALAVFGHTALWISLLNRSHAFALPCVLLKVFRGIVLLALPLGVLGLLFWWRADASAPLAVLQRAVAGLSNPWETSPLVAAYVYAAWACGVLALVVWIDRRFLRSIPAALLSNHTRSLDVAAELGRPPLAGWTAAMLARVPGNQFLHLDVNEKRLVCNRLPRHLEGMAIAHISDLHYTGKLTRDFYNLVVDETNALGADLIAVTGDILDRQACVDWLAPTLGRLRAPCGVYFVLGNHDWRLRDPAAIRAALSEAGLIDVGGRWREVPCRGTSLLLAGNEHPWFGPRPRMEDRPRPSRGDRQLDDRQKIESDEGAASPFTVLLAHTPDQIGWARRHAFDLMLAGHNHGGQIRFPIVGPIVSPSLFGVRYASGVFDEPPSLMHVSRGVAGEKLLRINCPPEITRLVLTTGRSES